MICLPPFIDVALVHHQQEDEYPTSSKRARIANPSTDDCTKFFDLLKHHGWVIYSVDPIIKAEYPKDIPDAILVSVWNMLFLCQIGIICIAFFEGLEQSLQRSSS
jgi:hypothetical protein